VPAKASSVVPPRLRRPVEAERDPFPVAPHLPQWPSEMIHRTLADLVLLLHFGFILFVVLGGLLLAWRRWLAWVHIPVALWGALITLIGWTCPLTPLENHLRHLGGQAGYDGSFIEHYLISIIYPRGIGPTGWILMGVGVVVINLVIYGWISLRTHAAK
jgi:hypothetical protein